jgi:hypothetical protein
MQPSEFWACDIWSVTDAYEGYAASKGIKLEREGLNEDDIEELKRMMEEHDRHR